jgi:hypothetical protein
VLFTPPGEDAGLPCGGDCNILARVANSGGLTNVLPATHGCCLPQVSGAGR